MIKKRFILLVPLLAVLPALWIALQFGAGSKIPTVDQPPLEPVAERDFMRVSLTYDAGTRTLRGTQRLMMTNRTGEALSEAVLRLYANGENADSVKVAAVTANGESVPFSLDEEDATVLRVTLDWLPGETVELAWTLMLKHQKADGAAIVTLPSLSVYENGAWRTDAYDDLADPGYAGAFDYVINLIAQKDTKAAFGGVLTGRRAETAVDELLYTAQMRGARDVSFALQAGGKTRWRTAEGVTVTAIADSAGTANMLLARAQEALEDLAAIGLSYPFDALTVAAGGAGYADGLVRSGLIALDPDGDKEALRRQVTRLAARQTFGVLVESDPWNAPWLSVSLASTAELLAFRERKGEAAYETRYLDEIEVSTRLTRPAGVTVGAGTAFFGSDQEMTQVLRDQGAAMLLGIESAVGEEAFLRALRAYVQENAGKIASRDALEAAMLKETGSDWHGYLSDELAW